MRKRILYCLFFAIFLSACATPSIPEPERCSLCDDLPRHAPCILNLHTGEKLELEIYEPHPNLVAEIAEVQRGGYFSFVRGAGAEGYKLGAESVNITIPVKNDSLDLSYFCENCRAVLEPYKADGYILLDQKNIEAPIIYEISAGTSISMRCYDITISLSENTEKYEIVVLGTYPQDAIDQE